MKNFRLLKITYPTSVEKQQQIVAKLEAAFAEIDREVQNTNEIITPLTKTTPKAFHKLL